MVAQENLVLWGRRLVRARQSLVSPAYRWLTLPFSIWLVTRIIVALGFYVGAVLTSHTVDRSQNLLLHLWSTWDSQYYLQIANTGYTFSTYIQSAAAFFPLYPLLINVVGYLVGSPVIGGLIISNAMLLVALILLYRLAELEFADSALATRALYYLVAFPTALFFSVLYNESTFLVLSIGTVYYARQRHWNWAALLCFLSLGTRVNGLAVWVFLLLEWLSANGWTPERAFQRDAWKSLWGGLRHNLSSLVLICLAPLSLVSFMVYQAIYFNDPLAFVHVQEAWGRSYQGFGNVLYAELFGLSRADFTAGQVSYLSLINVCAVFLALVTLVWAWRRLGASYGFFILVSLLLPASSSLGSMDRYVVTLFPMFFMLASWGRKPLADRAIAMTLTLLLGIFITVFVSNIFLG